MVERLNRAADTFALICAVLLSVISLYTAFFGIFETMIQRTVHLSFICVIGMFLHRMRLAKKFPLVDLIVNFVFAALIVAANIYLIINWKELYISPFLDFTGLFMGLAAIFILLELTRRTVGLSLAVIVVIFLVYAYFGS
jgi:TRAP-type uncharacterized transport system fused permease subunit